NLFDLATNQDLDCRKGRLVVAECPITVVFWQRSSMRLPCGHDTLVHEPSEDQPRQNESEQHKPTHRFFSPNSPKRVLPYCLQCKSSDSRSNDNSGDVRSE